MVLSYLIILDILSTIDTLSTEYHVPKTLILAIVKKESNFNPAAVSPCGAKGLMQLMPKLKERDTQGTPTGNWIESPFRKEAKRLHPKGLLDPKTNLLIGTKHLAKLLKKHNGNLNSILYAYNASKAYVKQVKAQYKRYVLLRLSLRSLGIRSIRAIYFLEKYM